MPVNHDGDNAVASYQLGMRHYHSRSYGEAIEALSPLRGRKDLMGQMARFHIGMAHRHIGMENLRCKRFADAERSLALAAKFSGGKADLSCYLASVYAASKRYSACAAEMERATEAGQENPLRLRQCALAQWRAGRRSEAYMTLTSALRRFAGSTDLHLQMGLFLAAEGKYSQARAELLLAVKADGTRGDAHYYLGLAAAAEKDTKAALESFQRALELRPDDLMLAYQVHVAARAVSQDGADVALRLPKAHPRAQTPVDALAEHISDEPDLVEAMLALPQSSADGELFSLLEGVLRQALKKHPRYADLHFHASRVMQRLGKTSLALEHAKQAVRINPRYVQAMVHLAELYEHAGRRREALACLQRAISSGADWPDVHCRLGELLRQSGESPRAKKHFARALQLNSNYVRAAEALGAAAA